MRRRLLGAIVMVGLAAMSVSALQTPAAQPSAHRFQRIADGVYAAIGSGGINVGSNSVVIVNDDDVVLVDSHVTPAAARALLDDIKTLTPKPVRYVIDTHYHWDHAHGNQVFGPDVQVIGHEFVRQMLRTDVLQQRTYRSFTDPLPAQLETLRQQVAAAADEERRKPLQQRLANQEAYVAALKEIRPTPPNVTYQSRMTLVRGGREIQLHFFGRGHTGGDTVVYLPAERVVATGDLVVGTFQFMYMGDGFVNEWADTVEKVLQLDFETVIPGHGEPFTDKNRLRQYQAYWRDLWAQAVVLRKQDVAVEEAAKRIDMSSHKGSFPQIQGPGIDIRAMRRMYEVMDGRELPQ
jgi:glyoxylase-like metal-dependent hydrolase (beta-lactamase superfamily II)